MLAFLDFEASSLAKRSYPIEVAWVFEDGRSESFMIHPAPDWTDWDPAAEAIHRIPRQTLFSEGTPYDEVARRMMEQLSGHDLLAGTEMMSSAIPAHRALADARSERARWLAARQATEAYARRLRARG